VTSQTPEVEQDSICQAWRDGKVDVLISTTIALVGVESSRCQCIIVVGYLYSAMSLIQAFGRLRPKQRGKDASISIFLGTQRPERLHEIEQEEQGTWQLLLGKGLVSREDEAVFLRVCTLKSLYEWCMNESQCRLQSLADLWGYKKSACGRCDCCLGATMNNSSFISDAAAALSRHETKMAMSHRARSVRYQLMTSCVLCNKSICSGECRGGCFKCGEMGHITRNCGSARTIKTCVESIACPSCFDLRSLHAAGSCATQKRLRGLIFAKKPRDTHIEAHIAGIFCNEDSFYKFLANLPS
jgi:superfamily II DNA helicase RecQ